MDGLLRRLYGKSAEKIDPNQLTFDLDANGVAPDSPEAPLEAEEVLVQIARLYQVETELRKNPELDRRTVRQEQSVPVLNVLHLKLLEEQGKHLPKSAPGKAIDYALTRWEQLLLLHKRRCYRIKRICPVGRLWDAYKTGQPMSFRIG